MLVGFIVFVLLFNFSVFRMASMCSRVENNNEE